MDDSPQRYKAVGILTWEIDVTEGQTKEDVLEIAQAELKDLVFKRPGVNATVRLDEIKKRRSKLVRIAEYAPTDILGKIANDDRKHPVIVDEETYMVRFNSHRYFVFRDNLSCVACGLTGTKMVLEQYPHQDTPHFNLYAEECGQLVLMTKDHIHSRAYGGKDRHSNYQTMCSICNNLKGSASLPLDGIRELRGVYDSHKDKVPRRTFSQMVREIKNRYNSPVGTATPAEGTLRTIMDLNIYTKDGKMYGKSVYDEVDESEHWVACVKAGRKLDLVESDDEKDTLKVRFVDLHLMLPTRLATGD